MAAAEGISTTYPSHPPEIVGVATSADEVPVLRSPPPSDDEDLRSQPVVSSVEDLRAKIIKQVEYYFSDENLPNDKFLLKQMKKDKDRFGTCDRPPCLDVSPGAPKSLAAAPSFLVSISLIGSFRKMKRLTKDISSIVDALKESSQLVLSSDGKKVKRRHPLPSNEESKLCTVVVANLPEDHSVQNIQNICGRAGSIKTISIHNPHAAADSVKRNKAEKLVNGKIYALVEYETVEAAEKAVAALNDETDWRNGLRVQHLQKRKGNGLGRKVWRESDSEKGGLARVHVSAKDDGKIHSNVQHDDLDDEDGEHRSKEGNGQKGRNRSKGRKYRGNNGMGHGVATTIESSNKPPPGPRMPDGTRGFTMGRGRLPTSCHS